MYSPPRGAIAFACADQLLGGRIIPRRDKSTRCRSPNAPSSIASRTTRRIVSISAPPRWTEVIPFAYSQ